MLNEIEAEGPETLSAVTATSGPPGSSAAIAAAGSAPASSIRASARSGIRREGGEMSIDKKTRAEDLRLYYAEKWRIGTIAGQLGVHHNTVDRFSRTQASLGNTGGAGARRSIPSCP